MQFPKIWLLRHGQTEWNAEGRLQGQLDSPLTEKGKAHAQSQAALLPPILARSPEVLVSPLGRAQQTAEIALAGHPYRTDDRLAEIETGDWQGLTRTDIAARWPELFREHPQDLFLYGAAPGGEGLSAFVTRTKSVLGELTRPTVIIAHGLLGQAMRGIVQGLDTTGMASLSNEQGCIYVLEDGREDLLRP